MDYIFQVPYLVRILLTLCLILIINRLTSQLALAIFMGITALAFWSSHPFSSSTSIALSRLTSRDNIFLLSVVFLVIWLSSQMKETGVMVDLVKNVQTSLSTRFSMAALPAVIGLLPMPGGALFSAPLVEECDKKKVVDSLIKTRVNYWFRHVWEFWWPLYPGVLLAVGLTGLEVWQFILLQFPLCIFAIGAGYLFLLRKIDKTKKYKHSSTRNFLLLTTPIIVVIAVYISISVFVPQALKVSKYFPMFMGILCALIFLQIQRPLKLNTWKKIIFNLKTVNLALIVALVRIYSAFIEARLPDGLFLIDHIKIELAHVGIPILAIVMILPFISGLNTGLAVGFVGASFPIVINLIGTSPELGSIFSITVLSYTCGWVGMILSPVHVCFIVTSKYFNTSLFKNLKGLIKPAVVVLTGGIIIYFLTRIY